MISFLRRWLLKLLLPPKMDCVVEVLDDAVLKNVIVHIPSNTRSGIWLKGSRSVMSNIEIVGRGMDKDAVCIFIDPSVMGSVGTKVEVTG